MEELAGLEYDIITEGVVRSMFGLLGPALKCLASKTRLTKEEADMAISSEFVQYTESTYPIYGCIWKPGWSPNTAGLQYSFSH